MQQIDRAPGSFVLGRRRRRYRRSIKLLLRAMRGRERKTFSFLFRVLSSLFLSHFFSIRVSFVCLTRMKRPAAPDVCVCVCTRYINKARPSASARLHLYNIYNIHYQLCLPARVSLFILCVVHHLKKKKKTGSDDVVLCRGRERERERERVKVKSEGRRRRGGNSLVTFSFQDSFRPVA